MNKKRNKTLLTILIYIGALILFLIISYAAVYIFWSRFDNASFSSLWANKTYHILSIFFALVFEAMTIFLIVKMQLTSTQRLVNRTDRAQSDALGSSRWQTPKEIQKNYGHYDFSLLGETPVEGYVINSEVKNKKLYVSLIEKQHSCVVGTTGTGKSWFFLSPTIQANAVCKNKPSMVINDLKGELYGQHSKMLYENGYNVIKIDLRQPHTSDRYNPLSLIWDLYQQYLQTKDGQIIDRVAVYISEIASILCPIGQGDQQQWSQGAQSIIKSVIWAMLEDGAVDKYGFTREMFTILQISNIVNRQKKYLLEFLTHRKRTSPVFDYAGMILDNPSEKTVGSYYATLSTALEGFLEPGLQRITSDTDVDITKLAEEPTAFFIIIPDELKTRNIVGTMILSQIYNYLTFDASQRPNEKLPRSVYFLLDEFGNLPVIPNFPSWISLGKSRGIFFNIIIQADSQLNAIYGPDGAKTIMQNSHLQVLLGAAEVETLKRFEDLLGKTTVYSRSANVDQNVLTADYKGSTSLTSIDLITLDQLQRMKQGNIYFKLLGAYPCKTSLVPLFDERVQNIFKRGALLEKGISGKAVEINKEKLYYDLIVRESKVDKFSNPSSDPSPMLQEKEELHYGQKGLSNKSQFIYVSVEMDAFEARLKPYGFKALENSYDPNSDCITVIIPTYRQSEAQNLLKTVIKQSSTDKNRELFNKE